MSRYTDLVCPSGLRVKLRSIKGRDIESIQNAKKLATGEAITKLLDDCTVEVIERGIYDKAPAFTWADALLGDRMKALIGVRIATSGDSYGFRVRCSDQNCRAAIDWELELSDLVTKDLPESSKHAFCNGNRFTTNVLDKQVTFRLLTGHDQLAISRAMQRVTTSGPRRKPSEVSTHDKALVGLSFRIVEVDGVTGIAAWLADQDLVDIRKLIEAMDEADCGVETTILVTCAGPEGCGLEQEVELPLDGRLFTVPK